jgi:hypothetical protein
MLAIEIAFLLGLGLPPKTERRDCLFTSRQMAMGTLRPVKPGSLENQSNGTEARTLDISCLMEEAEESRNHHTTKANNAANDVTPRMEIT